MHVAVAAGPDGGGVLRPEGRDARSVTDLAAAVRELEETSHPRWIWADTREIYPALLGAGVRLARCHDLALTEGLLLGYEGRYGEPRSAQAAHARLHGLPVLEDHQGRRRGRPRSSRMSHRRPTPIWSRRSTPTSSGGSRPSPTRTGSGCWSPPSRPER